VGGTASLRLDPDGRLDQAGGRGGPDDRSRCHRVVLRPHSLAENAAWSTAFLARKIILSKRNLDN